MSKSINKWTAESRRNEDFRSICQLLIKENDSLRELLRDAQTLLSKSTARKAKQWLKRLDAIKLINALPVERK